MKNIENIVHHAKEITAELDSLVIFDEAVMRKIRYARRNAQAIIDLLTSGKLSEDTLNALARRK